MKFLFRLALIALLPTCLLKAAEETAAPEKAKMKFQEDFSNLPKEKRDDFANNFKEAKRLYEQKRIFEALDKIYLANKIFPDHPELKTMEGACYVEFRDFDKARVCFNRANEIAPNQPAILFNIGELDYVTKNWAAAEVSLGKVLPLVKDDKAQFQLSRLVEFKLLLCKIKLGKLDEAKKMAGKYDFLDDSPYPYYAEAAIAYQEKRDIDAESALARAGRIFQNPAVLSPWQDTLIEFGYIKGFFGGDEAEGGGQ